LVQFSLSTEVPCKAWLGEHCRA